MNDIKLSEIERSAKSLVRLAVHKIGNGRMASEWTGIQESELSRYGNENVDRHIPLYMAMQLDEAAGWPMLKFLARKAGFELMTGEQRDELALNVNKLVGKLAHDEAALASAALDAKEDGVASHNEIKDVEIRASAVIDTAEKVVSAVTQLRAAS